MQLFEIYFDCLPIELRVSFRLLSALEQCLKQGRKILEVNGPQLFAGRQWQSAGQQDIEAQINSMFLQQSSSIQQQSQISSNFKDIINNDFINDSNAGLGFVKNQKNLEEKEEQIMEKDDPDSVNNDKSADSGIQNNEIWKGSVGLSLMMKFGWNGQDGIGLHQGIKQPIDVTIRKGKEGIGHNKYE
ncbi:MAG: hypothetical protein EZS28_011721 [Streblomastix strix]|uniref:G-patch domain-containing protein n=1 Tax=Streblomastix strix TaxID=222440 RepID=A0A5J4WE09_9EUKA|nr:MAG: hypothetical protein EZS28_011721 [Streblomastix strix]